MVVQDIETTLQQEFCCYGYHHMSGELKESGWIINRKKVYRLMKEHQLLYGSRIRPKPFKRDFIRFRSLRPDRPLQYLSMDIKYVHVHGTARNALLLTVIDIYSRKVLIHMVRHSIRKGDVLVMLSLMLLEYKTEAMTLRNDNGSQFIAAAVRQYLKDKGILQEFSHVAT
jgi:transposase InsO family protein